MKWLCTALILICVANTANAQNFKGSAYLASNFSHMRGDYMVGYNKPGLNLGLTVAYPFKEKLDLSMSISFSQKGSRATYNKYGNRNSGTWHLMRANYIEIPILARYHLTLLGSDFDLIGGLSMGRLLGEHLEYSKWSGTEKDPILRNYEWAFQLGASYAWKENYNIFFRHSTSIFSVLKDNFGFFFSPWDVGLINMAATIGIERKF